MILQKTKDMVKSLNILLIEDDTIEVMKLNRTIKSLQLEHRLIEAKNGEEALEILNQKNNLPDIILLDLNMPKINGIEFLRILKNDDILKYIPTIVLTTSNNHKDVLECYKIGIAGYFLKPLKYEDYVFKIEKILAYWSSNELIKI
jgi:CheY-like chemotaxis protein